jgi:surfactin synthase thioesterase subunit
MVLETYRHSPQPLLDVPIIVLVGNKDKSVTQEKVQRWKEHTISYSRLHMLDGGHFYLNGNEDAISRIILNECKFISG